MKVFGNDPEGQKRYSPAQCLGTQRVEVIGNPDQAHISTSFVERQNLNMRMNMRRFTRLTNAFSKKIDNQMHSIALFHMHYNFARIHQTFAVTPAMEAGLSDHVWSISELDNVVARQCSHCGLTSSGLNLYQEFLDSLGTFTPVCSFMRRNAQGIKRGVISTAPVSSVEALLARRSREP